MIIFSFINFIFFIFFFVKSNLIGIKMDNQNQEKDRVREKLIDLLKIMPKSIQELKEKGLDELIQEVEIYQYELEMQNEELKRANEKIQKLEQDYFLLFNNAPSGYAVIDTHFKILKINDTLANILDSKKSYIIGSDIRELVLPNCQDKFYFFINNLIDSKEKQSINIFIHSKTKKVFDVFIEGVCSISSETQEREIFLSIFDVGRFRQELTKISHYDEMYRFLERYPDPVVVHINGEIVYTNSSTYKIFDLRKEDLIGHNIFEYIHPNDHKKVMDNIEKRLQGLPFLDRYEINLVNKANKQFYVDIAITTIEHDGKQGDIIVLKDITKIKTQNIELQDYTSYNIIKSSIWSKKDYQSEHKLINTFILHLRQEYELSGVIYLKREGDYFCPNTYLGDFEFDIKNIQADIKLKQTFDHFIPELNEKGEIANYKLIDNNGNEINVNKTISLIPFYIDNILNGVFLLYNANNDKYHRNFKTIKMLIDEFSLILNEKRKKYSWDEQLTKLNKETQELNRIKSNFYMRVSNELRTPLFPIIGFTNYLLNEFNLPKEVAETLHLIMLSGQNVLRKLNNILDLVRLETDNFHIEKVKFDMLDFINQSTAQFFERAKQNKYEFNIELDPELNASFVGDFVRIGEILQNLLENAFQYVDTKKKTHTIELIIKKTDIKSAFDDENTLWVEFIITDNGIGLDEIKLNEIFEMSTIKSYSLYSAYEGKGLGLPLSISIANKLGGFINVKSEKGIGSEFKLVIPLIEKQ